MKRFSTTATALPPTTLGAVGKAWEEVSASFDRFCLAAGIEALGTMLENDAREACGSRHSRAEGRRGYRWGRTQGKIGFHGGRVDIERPRVRELGGKEMVLPSWERALTEDWLGRWGAEPDADQRLDAEVSAGGAAARGRHSGPARGWRVEVGGLPSFRSAVGRAHEGMDDIGPRGSGHPGYTDRRHHIVDDLVLVAAIGIDGDGVKHPLGLVEGATENTAVVQALIDNLVERGLDPAVPRLFIIDGAKALSKAIRRTFGRHTPIQRCQIHKARNIIGAPATVIARRSPPRAAPGLGIGRCGEGREADPQSCSATGT